MELLKTVKCFDGAVQFYRHSSLATKTEMNFSVFIPNADREKKPDGCMIWLSGLTCNEENFMTKAGAQKFLAEKNLMVICPDTSPRGLDLPNEHESWDFGSGAGFYLAAKTNQYADHYQMYDYINRDIYQIVTDKFGIDGKAVSISGHSMGGHGALVIGLRNPEKYCKISAFSPIVNPVKSPWGKKAFSGYLGSEEESRKEWNEWDATELVKSGKNHPETILIDQGLADEFLEEQLLTEHFQKSCDANGQNVEIRYHEGYDHSYYFVSSFIRDHI